MTLEVVKNTGHFNNEIGCSSPRRKRPHWWRQTLPLHGFLVSAHFLRWHWGCTSGGHERLGVCSATWYALMCFTALLREHGRVAGSGQHHARVIDRDCRCANRFVEFLMRLPMRSLFREAKRCDALRSRMHIHAACPFLAGLDEVETLKVIAVVWMYCVLVTLQMRTLAHFNETPAPARPLVVSCGVYVDVKGTNMRHAASPFWNA